VCASWARYGQKTRELIEWNHRLRITKKTWSASLCVDTHFSARVEVFLRGPTIRMRSIGSPTHDENDEAVTKQLLSVA